MSSPVTYAMVLNSLPSYAFEDLASFSPANTGNRRQSSHEGYHENLLSRS